MRHLIFISCLLAGLGLTRAAGSPDLRFYTEPSVVYAHFKGDIHDAFGASLAIGTSFRQVHSLALEVSYFKAKTDFDSLAIAFNPALLKYRYSLPLNHGWSAYVGVAGGAVFERSTVTEYSFFPAAISSAPLRNESTSYVTRTVYQRDTAGAIGAEVGVAAHLNEQVSVGLGLTTLELSKSDITTKGSMLLVNLKLAYQF